MSAPIHPKHSASCSTHRPAAFWNVAHRHRTSQETEPLDSAAGMHNYNQSRVTLAPRSQMYTYKKMVETIVRYLMKEGFTFIEAYEQVLVVGRLNPLTTANQLILTNPTVDPETFLEFKAHNAVTRLKRRYAKVIAALSS